MDALLRRTLFGTDEEVAESRLLRAGPLTLTLRGAKVRDIRCGGHEVWHGIAFLYRDADWGTPEPVVGQVECVEHADTEQSGSAFSLRMTGHFPVDPPIDFTVTIEGDASGRIVYRGEAIPRGDIQASRLGLCVMHPMSACGAPIEIGHVDGRISRSTFPTLILPWPPFMLIRAIRHEYAPGAFARCVFEGDAFELEDQRNNSDASFKTYSRSNLMPRPYWLRSGEVVRQSVELWLETAMATPPRVAPEAAAPLAEASGPPVRVRVGAEAGALPGVGIEILPGDPAAGEPVHAALRTLRPAHLHLALDDLPATVDWPGIARLLATADAALRLDVTLDCGRAATLLADLQRDLRNAGVVPERIAIFPSEERALAAARRAFPDSLVGGGTPHFFVQLNRIERLGRVDFLSFTTSPVVHGADDESVMLTLQSLPSLIDTLRAMHPELRFAVGPSTIGARRSPLGRQPETDGLHRVPLARNDPRCRGLYGAAWVLGYAAQLAGMGIDALTLMALTGPSGVVAEADSGGIERSPAYFVLERLRGPARVCAVSVSEPARVAALALRREGGSELLLANLTGEAVEVGIEGWSTTSSCAILDAEALGRADPETNLWSVGRRRPGVPNHVRLEAYAVAAISG